MQGTISRARDLAPLIDHTLLKPDTTEIDIRRLCEEARTCGFKAVCVNPIFVAKAHARLKNSNVLIASVIGFPLGTHLSQIKSLETERAIQDGASEIDMMIRLDLVKEARWREVENDIREVVRAAGATPVKVILETGLLNEAEIADSCKASESGGAAFVKTATGFLARGASIDDIALMRRSCSPAIKIKASGGIKSFAQAAALVAAGADRLGTSAGVFIVNGQEGTGSAY